MSRRVKAALGALLIAGLSGGALAAGAYFQHRESSRAVREYSEVYQKRIDELRNQLHELRVHKGGS